MSNDLVSALGLGSRAPSRDAHNHSRHKVFISFHEDDLWYKEALVEWMRPLIVNESVDTGSIIDIGLSDEQIWRRIRDDYIRDATVTIVLVGRCTWQRKFVDWEIGGSLMSTKLNSRCGLLAILLPTHADFRSTKVRLRLLPPRLADNVGGAEPFAQIADWPFSTSGPIAAQEQLVVSQWIHNAFIRRDGTAPDNGRPRFGHNRTERPCEEGWV